MNRLWVLPLVAMIGFALSLALPYTRGRAFVDLPAVRETVAATGPLAPLNQPAVPVSPPLAPARPSAVPASAPLAGRTAAPAAPVAAPEASSATTHVGEPVDQLVSLVVTWGDPDDTGVWRVMPDGSMSDREFQVPDGQILVVTDLSWGWLNGTPSGTVGVDLQTRHPDTDRQEILFEQSITLDSQGYGQMQIDMATGFTVGPGIQLAAHFSRLGQTGQPRSLWIRGYLTPAA